MDVTQEVIVITSGVIVGSALLRYFFKKCKREYFSTSLTFGKRGFHNSPPANTPLPPKIVIQQEEQQHPQPSAPPSYTYVVPVPYYQQNNSYNSYSSYPQENRYVVYVPPISQTARHI